jgi:undecaprenyl-diphosphatase
VHIPVAFLAARALRRRGHHGGSTIAGAALSGWLAVRLMRVLIHRKRPPRPPGRGPKRESTFPSGHSTELTALALAAAYVLEREQILTPRQARTLGIGLPVLIGLNRVYVREHWLTDVLGGWALGAAVGLACVSL